MSARHQKTGTCHQGSQAGWKQNVRRQKQCIWIIGRTAVKRKGSNNASGQQTDIRVLGRATVNCHGGKETSGHRHQDSNMASKSSVLHEPECNSSNGMASFRC
ncbi:hypothetical protein DPMN_080375 [Dreissena polymorpha]|uniref:Uncharacterized protein n=1 Tax=Dreissena polymorpha TaxID=45954 RepID=A0A9D3YQR9_DREPO|nr:hypothetical protein DPMN_080375 [Dreissena polymorpha]